MKNRLLAALVASVFVGVAGFPSFSPAATSTTHYSLTKPAVNDPVDQDLWGTELNSDLDTIDTTLFGLSTPAESSLTFTDITTSNTSTSKHGFCPKLPNDATKYLDGTGAWSVPVGSGGGGGGGGGGSAVTSVAGRTGDVVLSTSDISGLNSPIVTSGSRGKIVMGSVTIQWGKVGQPTGSTIDNFSATFSGTPYSVSVTLYPGDTVCTLSSVSTSQIQIVNTGSPGCYYTVIGPT